MVQQQPIRRKKRNLKSRFTGTVGKYFFLRLGLAFLSLIPFCLPAAICIWKRYECRNTQIVGMTLEFTGKAGELLGRFFVWGFFSVITLGIYAMFYLPVRYKQWMTMHTVFGPVLV